MPEPLKEPKKGESILEWCRRLAREVIRLARLLDVHPSGGLEVVSGTLRALPSGASSPGVVTARTPAGGLSAKVGNTSGAATCTFYNTSGANQPLGSTTATVYNDFPTAFDGNRVIKVHWEGGAWRVLVESCS